VRTALPGKLRHPPASLELIAQACDWHVCPDREAGWDHPVLWLLKDADGLDRARLHDLDPSYLRHRETRRWLKQADLLYRATRRLQDPDRIWQRAAGLGLPVAELLAFAAEQSDHLVAASASGWSDSDPSPANGSGTRRS
jgi:hypothetical protein